MKRLSLAGLVLIILGVLGVAYHGLAYTKQDKVVDVGPIHATKDTKETIAVAPILSGLALIGGMALMVAGSRSKNYIEQTKDLCRKSWFLLSTSNSGALQRHLALRTPFSFPPILCASYSNLRSPIDIFSDFFLFPAAAIRGKSTQDILSLLSARSNLGRDANADGTAMLYRRNTFAEYGAVDR
jgi:hypothetical protein